MTLSLQRSEARRAHPALLLLILWCVAVSAVLLIGPGAIWLRSWGPAGVQVYTMPFGTGTPWLSFWSPKGAQVYTVPSGSMMPTLHAAERVLSTIHMVQQPTPRRGDIIVHHLRTPGAIPGAIYVKRVVGLPGDRIQLVSGRLHINGTPVPRERVEDFQTRDTLGKRNSVMRYRETFPEGTSHFVIEQKGDRGHWDNTEVTRVPEGEVFVMGDNRDNSVDSRDSKEVGTVPVSDIIGSPVLILWSEDKSRIGSVPR